MATIQVDIVSAEGEIYAGEASMVFAPARMGEVGIAPRHAPLLTGLKPGGVRVQPAGGGGERFFYVSGGMLEVQPNRVIVRADTAQRAKDLEEAAAEEARRRAEEMLKDRDSAMEVAKAQAELSMAMAQLQLMEKLRKARKKR